MKRLFFLFILLTAIGFSAHSQKLSLSGLVLDKQSGEPLPGATISVEISEQKHLIVSGLNGTFVLKNLPAGEWKVKAVYIGYKTFKTEIAANSNLTIEMEKNNKDLAEVQIEGKHDKGTDASAMRADRKVALVQNSVSARTIEISPDL